MTILGLPSWWPAPYNWERDVVIMIVLAWLLRGVEKIDPRS